MLAPPTPRIHRAAVAALVALFVGGLMAPASAGEVTRDDIDEAEAAAAAASARLDDARSELDAALELQARLESTIASVTTRRAEADDRSVAEAAEVRSRLTRMYMAAGRSDLLMVSVGDLGVFFTRIAYLGAVANRDREVVNRFVLVIDDLEGLERQARAELEDVAGEVSALEVAEAARAAELDGAIERLDGLREQWEQQEAARQAALEAELRRQEEELAQQAAAATSTTTTTTTTTTGSTSGGTTTTTVPGGFSTDDGGYTFDPGGGVEQWRPLLTSIFARWGLDQEKCGPNGCLGPHMDDALTIMWCESRGVPFAVNPSSGTTGLYQHRPVFWSDRVARTRSKPWSTLPANATPYNAAHNIEVAALLIWESRETLIGNLGYGRPWSDGPQPFGHWDGTSRYCASPPLVSP